MRVAVFASGRGSNFDALWGAAKDPSFPARLELLLSDRPDAPVIAKARSSNISTQIIPLESKRGVWEPRAVTDVLARLREARIEGICLAGFMRVVPSEILDFCSGKVLNIHPSLLPAFPGLHAQRQALQAGVKVAGCTVHFVDEGVDTGPIILQASVPVFDDDTEEALASRILVEEHRIYPEALRLLATERLHRVGRRVFVRAECSTPSTTPGEKHEF